MDITILSGLIGLCHWGTYLDFLLRTQTAILTTSMMNQEDAEYCAGHCISNFYDEDDDAEKGFYRGPRYLMNCDWSQSFNIRPSYGVEP